MPEFTHTYTRALVDGAFDLNHPERLDMEGDQILLAKEIEAALPGISFVVRMTGTECRVIVDAVSDLSVGDKNTLDTVVSTHKANA